MIIIKILEFLSFTIGHGIIISQYHLIGSAICALHFNIILRGYLDKQ